MPQHDPARRRRRSIRLRGYDYTHPGAYFVTICTRDRQPLFGHVVDGEMVLNEYGEIVREEWFRSAKIRDEIELFPDEFVVMPNHIHGIVWVMATNTPARPTVGAHGGAPLHRPPHDRPRHAPTNEQFGKPTNDREAHP